MNDFPHQILCFKALFPSECWRAVTMVQDRWAFETKTAEFGSGLVIQTYAVQLRVRAFDSRIIT